MTSTKKTLAVLLTCVPLLLTLACSQQYGKVDQGRVIAFDKQSETVTLIKDSSGGADKPKNDVLPPEKVKIPADLNEMGPLPDVGKRLLFDTAKRKIVFYDVNSGAIKTVAYTPLSEKGDVKSDDPQVKGKKFPVVDRDKKAITLYSSRDKKLVVFQLPDEYASLPDDTWKAGDDVRYYYKEPGQALRMMNVTKTNIMKGK
jgi:hypothetical protein